MESLLEFPTIFDAVEDRNAQTEENSARCDDDFRLQMVKALLKIFKHKINIKKLIECEKLEDGILLRGEFDSFSQVKAKEVEIFTDFVEFCKRTF